MKAPVPVLKPYHAGLSVFNAPAAIDGINHLSVRIDWASIEPSLTPQAYDWTNTVDAFLGSLLPGQFGKIAVQAGIHAPTWLKNATGTVNVLNVPTGRSGTVPHWWEPVAQDAWDQMMTAMAARYDTHPQLLQVVAAEATSVFSEPFIMGGDTQSGLDLYAAGLENPAPPGYTQADAITTMLDNTLAAWKHTRVELALHGTWEVPYSGGVHSLPWTTLRDFINPFAITYGERLTFTDYGLGEADPMPPGGESLTGATTQYGWMKARAELARGGRGAGPCGYQQTLSGALNDPNVDQACKNAEYLKGNYFESAGFNALTQQHRIDHDSGPFGLKTIAAAR